MSRPPIRSQSVEPTPADARSLLATTAVALAIPLAVWTLSRPMAALAALAVAALLGALLRAGWTLVRHWRRHGDVPPRFGRHRREV